MDNVIFIYIYVCDIIISCQNEFDINLKMKYSPEYYRIVLRYRLCGLLELGCNENAASIYLKLTGFADYSKWTTVMGDVQEVMFKLRQL